MKPFSDMNLKSSARDLVKEYRLSSFNKTVQTSKK